MDFRSLFTPSQLEVLADLHERDGRERRDGIRDASSLKALAPQVARLLQLLALCKGARTIVEFGTSHGYSTIHLAAAAEKTDGHVHSVDLMPEKTARARENLRDAGLLHRVTLTTSDGADFAASLPGDVDLVLVDYGVPAFMPAFEPLRDRMAEGCLFFVDGGPEGYWQSGAGSALRERLEADPDFLVTTVRMNKEHLAAVRGSGLRPTTGAGTVRQQLK